MRRTINETVEDGRNVQDAQVRAALVVFERRCKDDRCRCDMALCKLMQSMLNSVVVLEGDDSLVGLCNVVQGGSGQELCERALSDIMTRRGR